MTRPIRYLPSHDVIAMRYACMVCGHCSHCCCRACFSRKLCSCGVGSVIMEVYDGVRNLWFSVISKPYRLRSLVFRVCMNACAHVADNPIGLFLLRFRCSMNNHTNSEYLSNMRGHVEIIQINNIMAVKSEAGTRRTAHCSITALRL